MSKKLFIANWKSHKTLDEAASFLEALHDNISQIDLTEKEIIIAPSFQLLMKCRELVDKYSLPVRLAAQNVSSFPMGAYTGEVNAKQVREFCEYVIIGHSERRKYMHESESDIENKIREANEEGLRVIQCIQDENSIVYEGAKIIAYEPPSAIGSGNPDDPGHISKVFDVITQQNKDIAVLYGGSVTAENFREFLSIEKLSGFLVGGASLESKSFLSLLSW